MMQQSSSVVISNFLRHADCSTTAAGHITRIRVASKLAVSKADTTTAVPASCLLCALHTADSNANRGKLLCL